MNHHGQTIVRRMQRVTEIAQRLKQGSLRALMHPRHSMQSIDSIAQTNQGGQEARRGPSIPHKQFQRLRRSSTSRNLTALTVNGNGSVAGFERVSFHIHHVAQLQQALDHHLRVFTPQRTPQNSLAFA